MRERARTLLPPEALELVAARFRVLGDVMRLRLLEALMPGDRSVSELAVLLKTSQPNASKHLKVLQGAGVVGRRQDKNTVYYTIIDESVFAVCDLICVRLANDVAAQAKALGPSVRRARARTASLR